MQVKGGRSLLLIAVFSAILIFILVGLIIKSAALQASENAKKNDDADVWHFCQHHCNRRTPSIRLIVSA
ncbi:hypothetical protein [Brochothrix campestris]|uniref:Uncharacterized protein n=1 Tax=Brochothrix campestris FSL F6-1037 TaxID=1265861 RepID=W7CQS5_9LIST|nr:hypothetical protein [Brochothrix campestris]EUJ39412.1 hypothetical protein BCAMP_07245 [Brochothrix campestris FSL F6-1037]